MPGVPLDPPTSARPPDDPAAGGRPEPPDDDHTSWPRGSALGSFLRTESGSSGILLVAALAGLLWANLSPTTYSDVWHSPLTISLGRRTISLELVEWVNSALMAVFFFVVGLEARRELDLGEFRRRRNLLLPLGAGLAGMAAAAALYLLVTWGSPAAAGWGIPLSTDTAFALGVFALVGRGHPRRLRAFLLSVVITDDVVALGVVAVVYSDGIDPAPLAVAIGFLVLTAVLAAGRFRYRWVYLLLAVLTWVAVFEAGVDPVVVGLAFGLMTYARRPDRESLQGATDTFRSFREQPTAAHARTVQLGLRSAVSPNERLLEAFHPWSSFFVVPVFAVANTGVDISPAALGEALRAPVTLAVFLGLVVGKPLGVVVLTAVVARLTRGAVRPPIGWAGVLGTATVTGVGFTLSILIASLVFEGDMLAHAKIGVLLAAVVSALLTAVVFLTADRLPHPKRGRALFGSTAVPLDLMDPVDARRDHVRGNPAAAVTLVEYGDFECPHCGRAEGIIRDLLAEDEELRYVWRHLPLRDVHPHAQLAAEAAEAAHADGQFWEMHRLLLAHQGELGLVALLRYADQLGLDPVRFRHSLLAGRYAGRVEADVVSADLSDVTGTPTFFINGHRYVGPVGMRPLHEALELARAGRPATDDSGQSGDDPGVHAGDDPGGDPGRIEENGIPGTDT